MPTLDIALTDIPEGVPHRASADDVDILLIRRGDTVTALTHECPHLGLPLSKGVIDGDTLICPFHHACFDARTGRQTQPPGHGDLHRYDVTVADGRVTVEVPAADPHPAPRHARRGLDPRRIVIAGAGAAGEACALALREEGFEGVIEMIAPEGRAPYDRTMLSKAVLAGGTSVDDLTLTGPDGLADRDITLVPGRVAGVAPGQVTLAGGGTHAFDALLLAPGGTPRRPDLPGIDVPGIHTLRSAEDAARLGDAARDVAKVVLVGGGFIGLEGALSLTKRGFDVTVTMQEDVPLARILGDRVGRTIMAEHEAAGVRLVTGAKVARLRGDDKVSAVELADGTVLDADLVLLAIGVRPATGSIDGLPRRDDGSIRTGPDLSVPGHDGVFVAGDSACAPTPFGDARIEHWRVARQHGRRVARAMLGKSPGAADIPFFWTALARQYRYLGHAEEWDDILFDGDPSGPFLARYVRDGKVVAALTAGRDADLARLHLDMRRAGGPLPARPSRNRAP